MQSFDSINDPAVKLTIAQIVHDSLDYAFKHAGMRLPEHRIITLPNLQQNLGCFVSLSLGSDLRGCVGSTQGTRRLDHSIAWYAHDAAFNDPRFDQVEKSEWQKLTYKVSIVSTANLLAVSDETELLARLKQEQGGLAISYGQFNATFLPCQWQNYPSAEEFLAALKEKAGWPVHGWTAAMKAYSFKTMQFTGALCGHSKD